MLHKELTPAEAEDFKAWARDNFDPDTPVNETWHPVVREEWDTLARLHLVHKIRDMRTADYAENLERELMEARAHSDEHAVLTNALMVTLGDAIDDRIREALHEYDFSEQVQTAVEDADLSEQVQAAIDDADLSEQVRSAIEDMVSAGSITVEVESSHIELDLSIST